MIIIDEKKLRYSTIAMIGEDYDMNYDMRDFTDESYGDYLKSIIERFYFDIEEIKNKAVQIIKDNLKVELKLV